MLTFRFFAQLLDIIFVQLYNLFVLLKFIILYLFLRALKGNGMIKKLAGSIREYKRVTILTPVLITFEVIMECLIPFVTAELVNTIKFNAENNIRDLSELFKYGGMLFAMACLSLLFGALAGNTCATASSGFAKNLRHDLYYKIQDFSFENIDRFSTSSLVTRLTTDVANVEMSFMMIIRTAVRSPLMFLFAIFMSAKMGGRLALMFVVVVPVLAFGLFMVARKAMPRFRSVFRKYDKLNASIQENVKGMRVVKSFVREDFEKQKFDNAAKDVCADFTAAERIVALNNPIMQFCLYFDMIFVLFFGSYIIITSRGSSLDVGQFSAMLTYGVMILMSLMMLSMIYVMITISIESARRIVEVLDESSTVVNPENPVFEVKDGSIVFDNVKFKYSKHAKRFALDNVSLEIKSGMTVGIIGGTGSSKSTLVGLIPRLYDVTEGEIRVGGTDVRSFDLNTLRNAVAVVLQKNVLFSGTIKENLRWGNPDATDEELIEACKLSCADEFIQTFPDKYDSYIEQGGANVSGGQKQRLCIARALLKKPKILILDDSTSAVDTKTDALIRKAFREYIPETTKIIIAQRISSVSEADMIVVMDGGRISDVGTHAELLEKSDIYREVYESQTKGGADDEE